MKDAKNSPPNTSGKWNDSEQQSASKTQSGSDANELDSTVLESRLGAFSLAWHLPVDVIRQAIGIEQDKKKSSRGEGGEGGGGSKG